jgi:hypothetical protein
MSSWAEPLLLLTPLIGALVCLLVVIVSSSINIAGLDPIIPQIRGGDKAPVNPQPCGLRVVLIRNHVGCALLYCAGSNF